MPSQTKILGIIPAREGSKGLPGKNIKMMAGSPLIAWTSKVLLQATEVNTKICSTDSHEVKEICTNMGLDVPFIRPKELATDEAPVKDVIRHALDFYAKKRETFTHVLLLQATSPTVTIRDLEAAIDIGMETDADTVISCYKLQNEHPSIMYYSDQNFLTPVDPMLQSLRRQEQPFVFVRTGLLYLFKVSSFLQTGEIMGDKIAYVEIEENRSIAIDDIDDWDRCEKYLKGLS